MTLIRKYPFKTVEMIIRKNVYDQDYYYDYEVYENGKFLCRRKETRDDFKACLVVKGHGYRLYRILRLHIDLKYITYASDTHNPYALGLTKEVVFDPKSLNHEYVKLGRLFLRKGSKDIKKL